MYVLTIIWYDLLQSIASNLFNTYAHFTQLISYGIKKNSHTHTISTNVKR